jgi:hypothetical protein
MQLHPALVTTLIAEHERDLHRDARRRQARPRSERPVRSAPWPP